MDQIVDVPMTPALEMLIKTRHIKTEKEVEDEFHAKQVIGKVKKEKKPKAAELDPFTGFDVNRKKSKLLLMPS